MAFVRLVGTVFGTAQLLRVKPTIVIKVTCNGVLIIITTSSAICDTAVAFESFRQRTAIDIVPVTTRACRVAPSVLPLAKQRHGA